MDRLTASEALYGFMGWLSTRKEILSIGSTQECGILVEKIEEFRTINELDKPRDGWEKYLKHPAT